VGRLAAGIVIALTVPLAARAGTLTQDVTIQHGGLTRWFDHCVPDARPHGPRPIPAIA
jgi:hypothetical protein